MFNIAILSLSDFENWNNQKSLSMGGSTGVVKSILPYLRADSIYLMGITSNRNNLYREIKYHDNISIVPIVYIPRKTRIPFRFYAFLSARKINNLIKKFNIHSVYSHAEELSFWIKPGFPVLYHMHGSTNALIKAKNKIFRFSIFQDIWEFLRRANIRKATNIIAIDPLCFDLTKKQDADWKTVLLPNFVDTGVFYKDDSPCKLLENIKGNILLFIGRIEEVKGLELFVDTLTELSGRNAGHWTGVFVGSGSYEPVIRRYIEERSSLDLFYFAGSVFEQGELRRIYNRATILMISSYSEGIPMVILESMACGTPTISTNVGGVKDLIADNRMCIVSDNRDPSEFADLIQSVVKSEASVLSDYKFSSSRAAGIINEILKKGSV